MPFSHDRAKGQLQEEQTEFKEQLARLDVNEYEAIGHGNHMADDATGAFDQAVDVALKRKVETSLEEVDRALAKFEKGTYGLCEACGARIERARLEVLPQARYCLECQANQERGQPRKSKR
jgi:RNA polymerase-binding transcription factor DksA